MKQIVQVLSAVVQKLYGEKLEPELSCPKPEFGDLATNVALILSKKLAQNPKEIAEQLAKELRQSGLLQEVTVAGPGFINLRLTDKVLWQVASAEPSSVFSGATYVLEYSCPNAFKELHTGHLYQTIYGDILARVLERAGAEVKRTSFGGDVGLHVAKCLWGMCDMLGTQDAKLLERVSGDVFERARWISQAYVRGAKAYEENEKAKTEISEINQRVYAFHTDNDRTSSLAQIYWTTRQWSFDYFSAFYNMIKVDDMHYYPESATAPLGLEIVNEQLKLGKLEKSDGAVIFKGDESQHLHTRVFVTSKGLPTYETKDIGVIWLEKQDYNFDHRILITGNDQREYMRVVYAAANIFRPGIGQQMTHLTNGTVRFSDGKKMSSRLGNVSRAADVLGEVEARVDNLTQDSELRKQVALGAVKYAFAKYRLGGDIAFDIQETVSLHGNSGPYIQYAHARACSILKKAGAKPEINEECDESERQLLRKLSEYPEVLEKSAREYMVHHICNYLYELAQEFNRFYEHNRVLGDAREALRLSLLIRYRDTLADGLKILGISAPEKM